VDLDEGARTTRRRGAELEAAILDAAWDVLTERGYARLTIEAVAERAQTSRPVLYRRWPTRADLLRAAIEHHRAQHVTAVPDTGSLRGDVLAALRDLNRHRADVVIVLGTALSDYYAETGSSPEELRRLILGNRRTMDTILERAAARGELDPARLSPMIRTLPFTLHRHELLMTLRPASDAFLVTVVDEVFLPLVTGR